MEGRREEDEPPSGTSGSGETALHRPGPPAPRAPSPGQAALPPPRPYPVPLPVPVPVPPPPPPRAAERRGAPAGQPDAATPAWPRCCAGRLPAPSGDVTARAGSGGRSGQRRRARSGAALGERGTGGAPALLPPHPPPSGPGALRRSAEPAGGGAGRGRSTREVERALRALVRRARGLAPGGRRRPPLPGEPLGRSAA